jgi:molecular chaperone GrpE
MFSKRESGEVGDERLERDSPDPNSPKNEVLADADDAGLAETPSAGGDVELTQARQEAEGWKDKFLRAKAEQQNALRRAENEREETIRYGNAALLRGLIGALDDLDRTIEAAEQNPSVDNLLTGVKLVRQKFDKLLTEHRVVTIEAHDQVFDPARHEALMQQPTADKPAGTVLRQIQRGYALHDRVLRPAKVIVAAEPSGEADA